MAMTRAEQGVLSLPTRSVCGYCLTPLGAAGETRDGQTYYECPDCAPCLVGLRTEAEWSAFMRAAWKRRRKAV